MPPVQHPVADDQGYVADERQHQGDDDDLHPGHSQDPGYLVFHILRLRELHAAARDELYRAVDLAAEAQRHLAQDRAGGDGGLQRLAVALAVDDDVAFEAADVEVVGDNGGQHVVGPEGGHAVVRRHGDGDLGYELRGAEDLAAAEILEAPVVEGAAVDEVLVVVAAGAVLRGLAAQDDGDEADPVLLGGGGEAVACGGGVAGLAGLGVLVVVTGVDRGVLVYEGVGVGQLPLPGDVRGRGGVADAAAYLGEKLVRDGLAVDDGHVAGGGVVVVVRQAVGVGKVRAGAAELGGQGVHLLHKGLDRAAYVLGDDIAGLVCGGEQRAVEQVLERHRLPGDYAGGAAVVHHALKAALAGRDAVGEGEFAALYGLDGDENGHDLRQRGGVGLGIRVLFIKDAAGGGVHQHGAGRVYLRLLQRERGQTQRRYQEGQNQNYRQQLDFFHINLRNNMLSLCRGTALYTQKIIQSVPVKSNIKKMHGGAWT